MTFFAAGAAIVGAGVGLYGSSQASQAQQKGAQASIDEQSREYDTTRNDNQTALDARNSALAKMQELAGSFGSGPTADQVMATPGYQFGLTQGQKGLDSSAAAAGGLYSGKQLKAASSFNTDYATTKYDDSLNNMRNAQNDQFNREASISGQGQIGANAINAAGTNMANQNSATYQGLGNAQGAAAISQANTVQNGINQGVSWYNNQPTAQPSGSAFTTYDPNGYGMGSSTNTSTGAPYRPSDNYGGEFADGGPVRKYAFGGPVGFRSPMESPFRQPVMAPTMGGPTANNVENYGGGSFMNPASPITPFAPRAGFGPSIRGAQAYADGGRVEPVVGTRTPLPQGGTGGGLSDIIKQLNDQKAQKLQAQQQQQAGGIGSLPANYLTHPQTVLDAQEKKNFMVGGPVAGPGGPKDDAIDAKLSNDEHVVTAEEITNLGEGSPELGHMRMAQLRAHLKGMSHVH